MLSKGEDHNFFHLGTGEALKEKAYQKILNNNMDVRAPNAEYSVRQYSRNISAYWKYCDYLNIPTN